MKKTRSANRTCFQAKWVPVRVKKTRSANRTCFQAKWVPVRVKKTRSANNNALVGDLRAAYQRRLLDVVVRENLLQVLDLLNVVIGNIGLVRVQRQVILMIGLRRIERFQRPDLGHDRLPEDLGGIELRDIGLRNLLLLVTGGEDRRAILCAGVRSLAVELGRIVRDRKEDLQDLAVADLPRGVLVSDGFGATRCAGG